MNRQMTEPRLVQERQARYAREAHEARLHKLAREARPATPPTGDVLRGRLDRLGAAVRGFRLGRLGRRAGENTAG